MASILDFLANGQQRRQRLDQAVGDFMTYITPPNLRPTAQMVAQMNPLQGMSDSMQQFGVAADPTQPADVRRRAAIGSGIEGLLAVTPAALAARGYMTPAQGVMESLLGGSPATAQIGESAGNLTADGIGAARAIARGDAGLLSEVLQRGGTPQSLSAMRVWHGSPHDFDKFSMKNIGTGEGAQSYGHGLYFAESPDVAKSYLNPDVMSIDLAKADPMRHAATIRSLSGDSLDLDALPAKLEATGNYTDEHIASVIDILRSGADTRSAGHLYEVNIDANPEDFLDWDAVGADQSPQVRKALTAIANADPEIMAAFKEAMDRGDAGSIYASILGDRANMGDIVANQLAATDTMRDAGISGISYLDAGSRGAGGGTRNYVVFDDGLLSILSKDGQPIDPITQRGDQILGLLQTNPASVTDDMLDMGDAVSNARLNEYLFNNYDLPMDEASRMARARDAGASTPAYRGTLSDEFAARPQQFVSENPDVAQSFAGHISFADEVGLPPELAQAEGGNIMPLLVDASKNTSQLSGYEMLIPSGGIRSRFARFDPRLSHLRNLSAGIGGVGLLGAINQERLDQETRNYLAGGA